MLFLLDDLQIALRSQAETFSECAKLIDFEENRSFLIVSNHNGQEIVSIQEGEDGVEPVIVQSEVPATKYQQHVVSNHCVQ